MSLCSTDKTIRFICNDEQIWKEYVGLKNNITKPWKELAKLTENEKTIIIYQNGRRTNLIISEEMSLKQILDAVDLIIPNNRVYSLELKDLFNMQERTFIQRIGLDLDYYNEKYRRYDVYYKQNRSIGHLLYTMLWQIDVSN